MEGFFFIIARVVVVIHDDLCDNEGLSTNTDIPYTMNDVLYKSKWYFNITTQKGP